MLRLGASAACLILASFAFAQDQQLPAAVKTADQYFSGAVVSCAAEKLTVARTVLGTNASSRTFTITADTQIEGKLKVNARVTVQYITKDDVDQAVHILVRSPPSKK
jgi:hypothetical protein